MTFREKDFDMFPTNYIYLIYLSCCIFIIYLFIWWGWNTWFLLRVCSLKSSMLECTICSFLEHDSPKYAYNLIKLSKIQYFQHLKSSQKCEHCIHTFGFLSDIWFTHVNVRCRVWKMTIFFLESIKPNEYLGMELIIIPIYLVY